jgi:hypothetical protein
MQPTATLHPITGATVRREVRSLFRGLAAAALLAMSLLALASAPALARDDDDDWGYSHRQIRNFDTWADGQLVDVQLRVDGEAAPLYFVPGRTDRHYLQAFAGRNYSIVLRNNSGRRIALLLAVDGLNAVNGEITRLRSSEPMYVLGPWEQATIRGWRTSLDEIRRFVFVDEQRSYAERTGQANSDMGWIRVLTFREQRPWWESRQNIDGRPRAGYRDGGPAFPFMGDGKAREQGSNQDSPRAQGSKDESAPAPTRAMAPESDSKVMAPDASGNLARGEEEGRGFPGTGWGERRADHVQRVHFTPEPVAVDRLILRYEYASGLRALGIIPVGRDWRNRRDERDGDLGFAKPPRR